jgi:hypothetical protein
MLKFLKRLLNLQASDSAPSSPDTPNPARKTFLWKLIAVLEFILLALQQAIPFLKDFAT